MFHRSHTFFTAVQSAACIAAFCVGAMISPRSAFAQSDNPHAMSNLELTFTPGVWLTRLNGSASLGDGAPSIRLEDQLNLDRHEAAFNAEATLIKNDRYRIALSGFHFSTDQSGEFTGVTGATFGDLTLTEGDPITAAFDVTSVAAEFGIWYWEPYCIGPLPDGRECRVGLRAGPVVGVRYIDVDQTLNLIGVGSESAGGEWLAPYAGLEMQIRYNLPDSAPLLRSFTIDAGAAVGPALGGDGGFMAQLHVGITGYVTQNIGIGFGYRLIHLNLENDDYEFDAGLQGLFLSASFRF